MNKNKKKILFLINIFKRGGSTGVFLRQINYLNSNGYNVYLGILDSYSKKDDLLDEIELPEEKIKHFNFKNREVFNISNLKNISDFITTNNIKMIYSTMDSSNIVSRIMKIIHPTLSVVVRESGMADRKSLKSKILDFMLNFISDRIIVQTNEAKKALAKSQFIHIKKIFVINNAVHCMPWDKLLKRKREVCSKKNDFTILNIATFHKHDNKRQGKIIEIFEKIVKDGSINNLKLIFIGEGVLREKYERLVKEKGLEKYVKFTGRIKYSEVVNYYLISDVLISYSLSEGFSNVLLEAMSFGIPVISTKVSGANEVIEDGKSGYLVDFDKPKKVSEILVNLASNTALARKIGQVGYKRVKFSFTFESHVNRLLTLFKTLLSHKRKVYLISNIKNLFPYVVWKLFHPVSPYSDYYVYDSAKQIKKRVPHSTLGCVYANEKRFHSKAKFQLTFMKKYGLRDNHKVVDFGCGSLRLGRYLISYLKPMCYWGIDVTDKFYRMGLRDIDDKLLTEKKPELCVIGGRVLEKIKNKKIDFVISTAVMYHVPPNELEFYFDNILSIMNDKTKVFVDFAEREIIRKIGSMTWGYPTQFLKDILERKRLKVEFVLFDKSEYKKIYPDKQGMMIIVKK